MYLFEFVYVFWLQIFIRQIYIKIFICSYMKVIYTQIYEQLIIKLKFLKHEVLFILRFCFNLTFRDLKYF